MAEPALAEAAARPSRDRRRALPRPAARHPRLGQGSRRRRRHADDVGFGGAAATAAHDAPVVRRLRRRRRRHHRQDQPARVRVRHDERRNARSAPCDNRYDPSRSAGGSSGGAAVGAGRGHVLRLDRHRHRRLDPDPAAACGIVGLKPTLRRDSTCDGIVPLSTHARSRRADGAARSTTRALMFHAMQGRRSSTCSRRRRAALTSASRPAIFSNAGRRRRAAVRRACAGAAGAATRSSDVEIAHARATPDVYLHIVLPEAARYPRAAARGARRRVFTGRAAAARDGTLHPGGGLRAGDARCGRC